MIKKRICFVVLIFLIVFTCLSCGKKKNENLYVSDKISNDEKIKLLLANERLDNSNMKFESFLSTDNENESKSIKNKVNKRNEDLSTNNDDNQYKDKKSSKREGDKYIWDDVSQSYSDLAINLEHTLEMCERIVDETSELIDYIKNEVRTTDKWVSDYLLQVDKNSETLFRLGNNELLITRRTIIEDGYTQYDTYKKRLDYKGYDFFSFIPGVRYESINASDVATSYFVANKANGEWEIFNWTTSIYEKYDGIGTVGIIGGDTGYYSRYIIRELEFPHRQIIVTDEKKGDYFNYNGEMIEIQISGLNGIARIESNDEENIYHYNNRVCDCNREGTVVLENGRTLKAGDKFVNGKVIFEGAYTLYIPLYENHAGYLRIRTLGNSHDENIQLVEEFFKEVGISTKQSFNITKDEVLFGLENVHNFTDFYNWNGNPINTENGIKDSIDKEDAKIEEFHKMYELVKDNDRVRANINSGNNLISFAEITSSSVNSITSIENIITIDDMRLTITDTSLLDKGKQYNLGFALAKYDNGKYKELVHIDDYEIDKVTYNNEETFTVVGSSQIVIPELEKGDYVLVCFIENEDGLRITKPISSDSNTINSEANLEQCKVNIFTQTIIGITVRFSYLPLVNITYTGNYNYNELTNQLKKKAYEYGYILGKIEKFDGTEWFEISENDEITSGDYRMRFEDNLEVGYVITTLE